MGVGFQALASLIYAFGTKLPMKVIMPLLDKGSQNTNPAVKNEALNGYKGYSKFVGSEAIVPFIEGMKEQLKKQLMADFEEMKGKPNELKRMLRSQAAKGGNLDEAKGPEQKEDLFDML